MRVFVTGATGFVGSYLVHELIRAGHHVIGLSRSDSGTEMLKSARAEVFRGDMNDLYRLCIAAKTADGIIHMAFNHDLSNLRQNNQDDFKVIQALGKNLTGFQKLIITSSTGLGRSKFINHLTLYQ